MSLVSDLVESSSNKSVEIAFNMFTVAHLRAMHFVLQGKLEVSPTTLMVIYEHQLLTEIKKEIDTMPPEIAKPYLELYKKDFQRLLDKNLVSNIT